MASVTIIYRNHRGEVAQRSIRPDRIWFGVSEWHPEPQWLLRAIDSEKEEWRDFALVDVLQWGERQRVGEECPDTAKCHHSCTERCWRVGTCGPLSGVFPGDDWPEAVRTAHMNPGVPDPGANALGPVGKTATSRKAALANYPRSGTQREKVLDYLTERSFRYPYGATRQEIEVATGLPADSVRPRVKELLVGGWIMVHPTITRRTDHGNDAEVLVRAPRQD